MSTGWKYILSDGREIKSQLEVQTALQENPNLSVVFSELTMAGTKLTDVTEKFKAVKPTKLDSNKAST